MRALFSLAWPYPGGSRFSLLPRVSRREAGVLGEPGCAWASRSCRGPSASQVRARGGPRRPPGTAVGVPSLGCGRRSGAPGERGE